MSHELEFNEFYTGSFRRLVGQIYAMTGSRIEAEDSVQEAYARAWQRWDDVREYSDREAWIRTDAYRLSVSTWRKAVNRATAQRRAVTAFEIPGPSSEKLDLIDALRRISPAQRRTIVLHYLLDMSIAEIAEETGAPEGTVKSHLKRGREALAPHVTDAGFRAPGRIRDISRSRPLSTSGPA